MLLRAAFLVAACGAAACSADPAKDLAGHADSSAPDDTASDDSGPDDTATLEPHTLRDPGAINRILVITLDTLRADHIGPDTMPFLASLEPQGVLWHNAWSQSWTYLGTGAILTGRTPATWGAESFVQTGTGQEPAVLSPEPGQLAPEVVPTPLAQYDIVPTLQALLGEDRGMEMTGSPYWEVDPQRALTGFWIGEPLGAEAGGGGSEQRHYAFGGGFHYIWGSAADPQLFDVGADPDEHTNLIGGMPVPAELEAAVTAQRAMTADYTTR